MSNQDVLKNQCEEDSAPEQQPEAVMNNEENFGPPPEKPGSGPGDVGN